MRLLGLKRRATIGELPCYRPLFVPRDGHADEMHPPASAPGLIMNTVANSLGFGCSWFAALGVFFRCVFRKNKSANLNRNLPSVAS